MQWLLLHSLIAHAPIAMATPRRWKRTLLCRNGPYGCRCSTCDYAHSLSQLVPPPAWDTNAQTDYPQPGEVSLPFYVYLREELTSGACPDHFRHYAKDLAIPKCASREAPQANRKFYHEAVQFYHEALRCRCLRRAPGREKHSPYKRNHAHARASAINEENAEQKNSREIYSPSSLSDTELEIQDLLYVSPADTSDKALSDCSELSPQEATELRMDLAENSLGAI